MDWSQFGMTPRGFRSSVDTSAYFPAPSHETALSGINSAWSRGDGVVLLDGPPGVGKSLLARLWLERLPQDVPRVVLPNVSANRPADLLQAILFDLNQPYHGLSEQELRLAVTAQLLAAAGPTVLAIDEAQNLGRDAIEELRLLGNIDTRDGPALFVLLVAQHTLRDALRRPAYEPFAQRVGAMFELDPLSVEESAAYLRHQARAAGARDDVFDDSALSLLAAACGGVPRLLNRAAAVSLDLAAAAGSELVDVEAVLEALDRLGLEEPDEPAQPPLAADGSDLPTGAGHQPAAARTPKQKATRKRSA